MTNENGGDVDQKSATLNLIVPMIQPCRCFWSSAQINSYIEGTQWCVNMFMQCIYICICFEYSDLRLEPELHWSQKEWMNTI